MDHVKVEAAYYEGDFVARSSRVNLGLVCCCLSSDRDLHHDWVGFFGLCQQNSDSYRMSIEIMKSMYS